MSTLTEGMDCPDFSFVGADGAAVTRADFVGKPFVLFFYPKDDTSGCTQEAVAFSALAGDFEAAGVVIAGVSPDSPKSHAKFRQKHALTVALLSDEEKTSLEAFGVWVEKSMYGRKYMGVERTTVLVGADGRIRRVWPKVKVPGHAQEVLKAAREVAPA
ncbi:peroxiredoxin [Antarcticirhabdus aurantiaca]|uniref:Peroxiredoxin n=2 Tax=Antarcticirhabdus aurantiaca TaxID=2606717 RepID=A0ACD4NW01_9HYPH|nr:peroxiredoxin [Antarcticirhabdus aurantiaca]WAJ31037.1 peroxiredoxin [Jeongeuplla avenae]